jgi:SAM-dependent methyltransferase
MTPAVQGRQAAPWPLARRAAAGLARPGGPAMARRALEGVGLEAGDRVVELAPGLGLTSELVLERGPRSWTAVEPDPIASEHLERALAGPGREVIGAPVDATALGEGAASVVLVDALLSTLPDDGAGAVLEEAARLLRAGGRLALHELAIAPGAGPEAEADLESVGLRPRAEDEWRALTERAGLVVVGSLSGRLDLPAPRDLMREAGPRTALRITRELARDGSLRSAATATREALERRSLDLRSALVVAEKPLVLGMRRPRR